MAFTKETLEKSHREPKPAFAVGDVVGFWQVLEYLGVQSYLSHKVHQYRVRCLECDREHIRAQTALNEARRGRMVHCGDCRLDMVRNRAQQRRTRRAAFRHVDLWPPYLGRWPDWPEYREE